MSPPMIVTTEQVTTFLQQHGDFEVYHEPANELIYHGVEALNKLQYWHWIKTFDPPNGFILSGNNHVTNIGKELDADDHTGATFACTMRFLQKMSQNLVEGDGPDEICSTCLSCQYSGNKTTLECGHMFHSDCIKEWHRHRKTTCPVCRQDTIPNYEHRR